MPSAQSDLVDGFACNKLVVLFRPETFFKSQEIFSPWVYCASVVPPGMVGVVTVSCHKQPLRCGCAALRLYQVCSFAGNMTSTLISLEVKLAFVPAKGCVPASPLKVPVPSLLKLHWL